MWEPHEDFQVKIDTRGWHFPVEIVFVPNPGPNPKDPLYYVTELRGTIKVVTRDRSILTYAENVNAYRPPTELPNELAELGLAGICLDPVTGYIFATTIYYKDSMIFNKIVRFEHETKAFALKPKRFVEFVDLFGEDESGVSHQIGKCAIGADRKLYVGTGDGHAAHKAQGLNNSNGKVLRLNLDGTAPTDNPFYDPQSPKSITSYIWAYGMRNPFGLALGAEDQVYVADNGPNWDRLVEVTPGKNYLWDGTNTSMRSGGIYDWHGSVGPAGMIFLDKSTTFSKWKERLLVAQGGTIGEKGPSRKGKITINSIPVKPGYGVVGKPEFLVSFKGNYQQLLVPVAEGPDGIYFSGFFPDQDGETYIVKLVPNQDPLTGRKRKSGPQVFEEKGCQACHQINGIGGKKGPILDGLVDRLGERLDSDSYLAQLDAVDQLQTPIHRRYQKERDQVRNLEGDAKIKYWIEMRLREPKFDVAQSQMPNFLLSGEEVIALTEYLLTFRNQQKNKLSPLEEYHRKIKLWWDTDYNARPTVSFILGVIITLLLSRIFRRFRGSKRQRY